MVIFNMWHYKGINRVTKANMIFISHISRTLDISLSYFSLLGCSIIAAFSNLQHVMDFARNFPEHQSSIL